MANASPLKAIQPVLGGDVGMRLGRLKVKELTAPAPAHARLNVEGDFADRALSAEDVLRRRADIRLDFLRDVEDRVDARHYQRRLDVEYGKLQGLNAVDQQAVTVCQYSQRDGEVSPNDTGGKNGLARIDLLNRIVHDAKEALSCGSRKLGRRREVRPGLLIHS